MLGRGGHLHQSSHRRSTLPQPPLRPNACSSSRHRVASVRDAAGQSGPVKRLIILRHADSISSSNVRDHERPISTQGKRQAASVSAQLRQAGWLPDLVVASNSKRTKQTLDHMAEAVDELADVDAYFLGSLYSVAALDGQTRQHMQKCLLEILPTELHDDKYSTVMLVGHNRGWEEAASSFAKQTVRLKTACAALLQVSGSAWSEVLTDEAEWQLEKLIGP